MLEGPSGASGLLDSRATITLFGGGETRVGAEAGPKGVCAWASVSETSGCVHTET